MMPSPSVADPFALADVYRKAGWVGTVPVPLGVKWPPPTGFTGADGRWPEVEDITRWSKDGPQNIALRLPPNVVALDVDEVDAFAVLMGRLGPLPATWRAHSGAGRPGHLYFRLPPGTTSEGWLAPCAGVDLLRHGHRYSVVWPSLHPSGSTYAWASPGGSIVAEGIPAPGSLPELPAAWIAHLAGDVRTVGPNGSVESLKLAHDGVPSIGSPITSGHDNVMAAYAASIVSRAPGLGIEEMVATVVRRGLDCVPPWADGMKAGHQSLEDRARTSWLPSALHKFGRVAPEPLVSVPIASPGTYLDWHQLESEPDVDVEWLAHGVLVARRGHVLYGATGIGKSLVTLELAVAIARGTVFLGAPATETVVLYVDHENDPRGDVWARLTAMGRTAGDLDNLRYLSFPEMEPLDSALGGARLLERALGVGAGLVIVDTATRTVRGEENSNDTWTAWDRHTGTVLRRAGIAFLRIDHSGKDADRGARGASNKSTDVDFVWQLEKLGDDEFALANEKARIPLPDERIAFRRVTVPHLASVRIAGSNFEANWRLKKVVWAALDEAGASPEIGRPTASQILRDAGIKARNALISEVLKDWKSHKTNDFAPLPSYAPMPGDEGLDLDPVKTKGV